MLGTYRSAITRFRKNSVFITTFIILSTLTIIVVGAFCVFASNLYSNNMKESNYQSNMNTLTHISNAVDSVLGQLLATTSSFMRNTNVVEAMVAPNERNYSRNRSVVEQITTIMRSDDLIRNFYLYIPSNETVYASHDDIVNYTSYFEFDKKEIISVYDRSRAADYQMFARGITAQLHEVEDSLYLYYQFPAGSLLGLTVIELNKEMLLSSISLQNSSSSHVYVYNGAMEPLFPDQMNYPDLLYKSDAGDEPVWERDNLICYRYTADTTTWNYICAVEGSSLSFYANIDFLSVLPFVVFFIVVSLCFALLITGRIYRPISQLMATVSGLRNGTGEESLSAKNEFDYFRLAFTDVAKKEQSFRSLTENIIPSILENLFCNILSGDYPGEDYIELVLNSLDNPYGINSPYLVLIANTFDDTEKSPQEQRAYQMRLEAFIRDSLPDYINMFCIKNWEGFFTAIINYPCGTTLHHINRDIPRMLGEINFKARQLTSTVVLTCGSVATCLQDIGLSYLEAKKSMAAICRSGAEPQQEASPDPDMEAAEELEHINRRVPYFVQLAMEGDRDKAEDFVMRLIHEIGQFSNDSHTLCGYYRQFSETLLSCISFLKPSNETLEAARRRLLEKLSSGGNIEYMQRQVALFCMWVLEMTETANNKNSLRHIQVVRDYILDHYQDSALSLHAISEHVGLSPSYLSRLFHEHTKQGFSSYVNDIRVEKAKRYLADKKMTSEEVARRCGFNSVQSFNRVFKKHVEMTPGQFRSHRKGVAGNVSKTGTASLEKEILQVCS